MVERTSKGIDLAVFRHSSHGSSPIVWDVERGSPTFFELR